MVLYFKRFQNLWHKITFLTVILFFIVSSCYPQKKFYVKDFGAIADRKFDNTAAINNCFKEAMKFDNSVVIFDKGIYILEGRINVEVVGNVRILIKGLGIETTLNFVNKDADKGFYIIGKSPNVSLGTVAIQDLVIKGPNLEVGIKNPFFDSARHMYGIGVSNIQNFEAERITVMDFYGNGIDISNKTEVRGRMEKSFHNVKIKNCKILDNWGKSSTDSYGDGIYIADCIKFEIANNIIINRIENTGWLGRAGIVIEDFTKNGTVNGNHISGYFKGVHIENSLGAIKINKNTLSDNKIGVYLWSQGKIDEKNIIVDSNKFYQNTIFDYSSQMNLNEDEFAFIVVLREKRLKEIDIIKNNKFLFNKSIRDKKSAIKSNANLEIKTNLFEN